MVPSRLAVGGLDIFVTFQKGQLINENRIVIILKFSSTIRQ